MNYSTAEHVVYGDARILELIAELNSPTTALPGLRSWAARSGVPVTRVVEGAELTYLRLAARDEEGGPIVLMRLEDVWERAI